MNLQLIEDQKGEPTGVFIPYKDWQKIISQYPDIKEVEDSVSDWEKEKINSRLEKIQKYPESLKPIEELFKELKRKNAV